MLNKIKDLLVPKLLLERKKTQFYLDDTFIVSYPKSGNTWLRFIIANLLKSKDENINFHNAVQYIPEIGVHDQALINMPRPRIIKSHNLFDKDYPQVIYVVRDARDVYVSYYHYLKKKLPESMTFSEFLRKPDLYPSRWHIHIESWIDKPNVTLLIKYEDLLENTYKEVKKITDILWPNKFAEEKIKQAIENSSFKNMKKIEKEKGRPFKSKEEQEQSTTFTRRGIQGDWRHFFSKEDEEYILNETGNLLSRLNYI
ncbi:MAG: sulfotransferase domain-containing protein [Xenococcaceae cyanobacterium]